MQGRLNGWFSKSLSQGGKEILLKSVALALPVFAMSCFKLTKDLCSKLTSAMIEFWWSNGTNRKKISWVAWQKLCKDKKLGGLGFKDIEKFNQALLAKQAWRIWKTLDSLLARILKHRYFAKSSFLECGKGTRPSYAWRSIQHGRELLKNGLVHKLGSGESTKVWTDAWIIDKVPRAPRYRQDATVDPMLTVDNLIDNVFNRWDVTRVRELFVEEDVNIILNTSFNRQVADAVVWGFSRNGSYDSKSGYSLLEAIQELQSPETHSLPHLEKKLWSDLWKTKTSPKLRHFLWRALSGALAVKERFRSRGVNLDSTCTLCGLQQETICHVLFTCDVAKETGLALIYHSRLEVSLRTQSF